MNYYMAHLIRAQGARIKALVAEVRKSRALTEKEGTFFERNRFWITTAAPTAILTIIGLTYCAIKK